MPDHIYIEPAAKPYPLAQAILAACPDCPVEEASDHRRIRPHCPEENGVVERAERTLGDALDGEELTNCLQAWGTIGKIMGWHNEPYKSQLLAWQS